MGIILMRHCKPELDDSLRLCIGITDIPLSEQGCEQARKIAAGFTGLRAIYSSDLRRASRTAEIIGGVTGVRPVFSPALREIDMGEWEGLEFERIKRLYPEAYAERGRDIYRFAAPGGENFSQAAERALIFLSTIRQDGDVLIVTHLGLIRALMLRAGRLRKEDFFEFKLDYGEYVADSP